MEPPEKWKTETPLVATWKLKTEMKESGDKEIIEEKGSQKKQEKEKL